MTMPGGDAIAVPPRRRRWLTITTAIAAILVVMFFAVTSGSPWATARGTVTAEQVGAGRAAVAQLPISRDTAHGSSRVRYARAELDGIGALIGHGFEPDRVDLAVHGGVLTMTGSHRLPLGRWLNVRIVAEGRSPGFPAARVRIGAVPLSAAMSRRGFELARWLANRRGLELPPLDRLVRNAVVGPDYVAATVRLPARDQLVDRLNRFESDPIDTVAVRRLYCGLATAQRHAPSTALTTQVHRAFAGAAGQANPAAYNRAAFVALAMLLVDPRAGDLAGAARAETERCRIEPIVATIHGRADLPKHWALSAALSAGAGSQLAQALGEWKELADSLATQSQFAIGDPSGFSFVDLAADRSGFGAAQVGSTPEEAARIGARLARARAGEILPASLLARDESLTNAAFVRRYGSTDDPRYAAMVAAIDAVLVREGIR